MRLVFFLSFSYCCLCSFVMKAEKHEKNKAQQEKEQKNEDDPKFIMEIRASLHFVHSLTLPLQQRGKNNTNRNHQSLKKGNSCKIIGMNVY